jgi:hypothetical protein
VDTTEGSTPPPVGLGGWLILVAVGLCLTPIRIAAEIFATVRPLNSALWHALTTPGARAYHPLFGPWIVGQLVVYSALLLWALALLYLFFAKKRLFPRLMIAFLIARALVQVADISVALRIPIVASSLQVNAFGGPTIAIIVAAIWVPYFLRSRRVAATFVH